MNKVYNGGFAPEFSVSMLKETIVLVQNYASETRTYKPKIESNKTLFFFFFFFFSENSGPPTFWILLKLYELC